MATAQVFSLFRPTPPRDWSSQDIAEFYRVESVLIQAGMRVTSTRGLSDEGDPWFVFCREEDDEVIIHFARIDGSYVISAPAYCGNATGRDFRGLVRGLIERHPMLQLRQRPDNLYLHPAALLVVLVATALVKLSPAAAAATPAAQDGADATGERVRGSGLPALPKAGAAPLSEADQGTLIQAAINGALALTVVAGPVAPAGPVALHAFELPAALHAAVVDVSPLDIFPAPGAAGTGSLTPAIAQHDLAIIALPADVTSHAATFTPLPADSIVAAGSAGASPPLPVAAIEPVAVVTYVSLSGLASIPQADKAVLQTLGLTGSVSYVNGLPPVFSDVVKQGDHTEVHPAAAQTQHTAATTSQAAADSTAAPDPGVAPPATVPATGADAVASPVSTPVPAAPLPDINTVITVVSEFEAIAVHPVALLTPNGAIFYDQQAVATTPYSGLKAITYDFGDGFSISLVGLPAELAYAVGHAVAHV